MLIYIKHMGQFPARLGPVQSWPNQFPVSKPLILIPGGKYHQRNLL